MVKKSKVEAETSVSLSFNGSAPVVVGNLENFADNVVEAIKTEEVSKSIGVDLTESKPYKRVVKFFGEDVAKAIANSETKQQLEQGIGNCQSKVSRATEETKDNPKYASACEIKADFDGALKEATAGDRAAIALRLLKLSMMRGK
jgi:hypothetical protein